MGTSVNRFKWARENIKKQNVQTVAKELEIPRSLIDEIESDTPKKRGVSYLTVKKLAEYYGVSMDWLCDILAFDDWSINKDARVAAEYTGLSSTVLEELHLIKDTKHITSTSDEIGFFAEHLLNTYNFFLANKSARYLLSSMYRYFCADFSRAYIMPESEPGLKPQEINNSEVESFPSEQIRFLVRSDVVENSNQFYTVPSTEDGFADLMLNRIMYALRDLRHEIQSGKNKGQ